MIATSVIAARQDATMAVPVPILLANAPTASCPIGITHIVVVVVLEGSHLRTRG